MNHTHRVEAQWQLRCYITTASTTGARVAAMAFTDPNHHDKLTTEHVWGAVVNGRGAMMDACGNTSRGVTFRLVTATRVLSNAKPPIDEGLLGYSAAHLITWVLQPPIGLGDYSDLNCTILARVCLKGVNPVPGFGLMQLQGTNDYQPVGKAAWSLVRVNTGQTSNSSSMYTPQTWAVSHTGNIPLAGGVYFLFWNAYGEAPLVGNGAQSGNGGGITIKGEPKTGCVYTSDATFPAWSNNRGQQVVPKFFTCIAGFASSHALMVGFARVEDACNQALGKWLVIPGGAELCLVYSGTPKWKNFNPNVTSTNQQEISFWQVYDNGASKPIYTNVRALALTERQLPPPTTPDYGVGQDAVSVPLAAGGWRYHPEEFEENPFDTDEETDYESSEEAPGAMPLYPGPPESSLTDEQLEDQLKTASTALARLKVERDERLRLRRKEQVLARAMSEPTLDTAQPSAPLPHWTLTPDRGWQPLYPQLPVDGSAQLARTADPPQPASQAAGPQEPRSPSVWNLLKAAITGRRQAINPD